MFTNGELRLSLHPPSAPQVSSARLPPGRWPCRLVLSTPAFPRPLSRPLSWPVHTRSPAGGSGLLQSRVCSHHPRAGRPTEAAALGGTWRATARVGPKRLHWGSRCGDLARDPPPLPRNSPTPRGQGRPSSRRRPWRPSDPQAPARVPEGARRPKWPDRPRNAAETRSVCCSGATEAG